MSKNKTDLEIVSELAEEIADENGSSNAPTPDTNPADNSATEGENSSQDTPSEKPKKKKKTPDKDKPTLTLKELALKKQNQNLAERKVLLTILAALLGIQLFFMNAIVLLIVLWCIFHWECFRELDAGVLNCIFDFTKYYVTAVLVELLGGIVYIVHSVFSQKD